MTVFLSHYSIAPNCLSYELLHQLIKYRSFPKTLCYSFKIQRAPCNPFIVNRKLTEVLMEISQAIRICSPSLFICNPCFSHHLAALESHGWEPTVSPGGISSLCYFRLQVQDSSSPRRLQLPHFLPAPLYFLWITAWCHCNVAPWNKKRQARYPWLCCSLFWK